MRDTERTHQQGAGPRPSPAEKNDLVALEIGDAEAALEAFARHCGDVVKTIDLDGRIVRWNAACEESYGWRADQVMGTTLPHIAADLKLKTLRDIREAAASGQVVEVEAEQQRADGTRMRMRLALVPIHDREGNAVGVMSMGSEIGVDSRLDGQRVSFMNAVSRELHNPLTAARGYAQLLGRSTLWDDARRRDSAIEALTEQIDSMTAVLDDLVVASRVELGALRLRRETVDLAAAVATATAGIRRGGSRVMLDFDPAIGPVRADEKYLARAVVCLVEHAIAVSPAETPVAVSVFARGSEAVVEVADSGPSVDVAECERAFERFFSAEATGGLERSLGAGMYLAREIARAHGGDVTCAPRRGGGNIFSLRMPLADAD